MTGAWLTYSNHETIQRAHYTLTKGRNKIESGYFSDPAGLSIIYPVNEKGHVELYLHHEESNRDIAIGADMLPRNMSDLVEGLENRLNNRFFQDSTEIESAMRLSESLWKAAYHAKYPNAEVEPGFFDPAAMHAEVKMNNNGRLEVYINYKGQKIPLKTRDKNLFRMIFR